LKAKNIFIHIRLKRFRNSSERILDYEDLLKTLKTGNIKKISLSNKKLIIEISSRKFNFVDKNTIMKAISIIENKNK
jgi:hypothetical protein